jgi:hypothetical protein
MRSPDARDARAEALEHSLAAEARVMRRVMAFARRHHMTGAQAQRFLARQRASLRRHRREARVLALDGRSLVGCPGCYEFRPITSLPYQTPCCGKRFFDQEVPRL